MIIDDVDPDVFRKSLEFRLRVGMPRYDDDGFRPVIEEILNDGPGPSAGPEDDTVLIFYGDAGMSQRPAETAVICIVSEGTVVRKMNRIDGADDAASREISVK